MAEDETPAEERSEPQSVEIEAEVQVRDLAKREMDIRIMPWNVAVDTLQGPEEFSRGAFADTVPSKVLLMGLEHEVHFGAGQDGRPVLTRHPVGKGISLTEQDDGAHMTFRVANTQRGDEVLALAAEGIVTGASVEFREVPGGTTIQPHNGRRRRIHNRVVLTGVATTYRPAYGERAAVLAVRSQEPNTEIAPMADQEAPVAGAVATPEPPPPVDLSPITAMITAQNTSINERFAEFRTQLEERSRADFTIPAAVHEPDARSQRGEWMQAVTRMLSGERVNDLQLRALADLITSDNVGVVPDAFLTEIIGVIDPSRPFLGSTRRLDLPPAGMSLVVPKIVTRPTTGVQSVYGDESQLEKSEIVSTATSITNVTFDAITIAGGGDISLQLLKRSSPSYLSLFLELLAEAYGANAEAEALDSLLSTVGGAGGVNNGGTIDPELLLLGPAWQSGAAVKKPITTMWLSSAAVAAFIDAKATTTNAPLYSQIQSGFTAGAGPAGTISGLRPVYVPELDNSAYDVLVGPSSGFGWTEDGTYTLQVDVPAKAGRDVALVGILWFAPMYPTAFTAYVIGS